MGLSQIRGLSAPRRLSRPKNLAGSSFSGLTKVAEPLSFNDLEFWLDPKFEKTLTFSGSLITNIQDRSKNKYDIAGSIVDGEKPTQNADGSIDLEGNKCFVADTAKTNWAKMHTGPGTWLICCKLADFSDTSIQTLIATTSGTSAALGFALWVDSRSGSSMSRRMRFKLNNGSTAVVDTGSATADDLFEDDTVLVISIRYDQSGGDNAGVELRINHMLYSEGAGLSTFSATEASNNNLSIGALDRVLDYSVDMYEICFYSRYIDDSELIALTNYMMDRHGVSRPTHNVYLQLGQSNMEGRGDATGESWYGDGNKDVFISQETANDIKYHRYGYNDEYAGSGKAGIDVSFAETMATYHSGPVTIIKDTEVGTALNDASNLGWWNRTEGIPAAQYQDAKTTITDRLKWMADRRIPFTIQGIIWGVGETDSGTSSYAANYGTSLDALMEDLRPFIRGDQNIPVVVMEVNNNFASSFPYMPEVNARLAKWVSTEADTQVASFTPWTFEDLQTVTITNVTNANPAVVTYTGTDPNDNNLVTFSSVGGMTELNGNTYLIANVDDGSNTFELANTDSSAFGTYTSGGSGQISDYIHFDAATAFLGGDTIAGTFKDDLFAGALNPTDVASLALDLDPASGVTLSTDTVTGWEDAEGGTAWTAGGAPLYDADGYNGAFPLISFGQSDYVETTEFSTTGGDLTIFIVGNFNPTSALDIMLNVYNSGIQLQFYYTNQNRFGHFNGGYRNSVFNNVNDALDLTVFESILDFSNTNGEIFLDGINQLVTDTYSTEKNFGGTVTLNAQYNGTIHSNGGIIEIARLLVFEGALTPAQRGRIRRYLYAYYQISESIGDVGVDD